LPTIWQYEWVEAFIHIMNKEELIFSDWENNTGKKEYSSVGGCYYSVRFAISEALNQKGEQAGAIVFREAYPGYVPLGVWLCREVTRRALDSAPQEFTDFRSVLSYLSTRLWLPIEKHISYSKLTREMLKLHIGSCKQQSVFP
jgi:hypothetical protein